MSNVRCPVCKTIADTPHRFCYVCGAEYVRRPRLPIGQAYAQREAKRDSAGSKVALCIFGILGAVGSVIGITATGISGAAAAALIALVVVGVIFGLVTAFTDKSAVGDAGKSILFLFSIVGVIAAAIIGILLLLFVACVVAMK